jgi:hypothetical protein
MIGVGKASTRVPATTIALVALSVNMGVVIYLFQDQVP